MLFDTTFLIDLQRETTRRQPGRAFDFLRANPDVPVRISIITYGEFAEGFPGETRALCMEILRPYPVLGLSEDIAWRYGQISRDMRQQGTPIGDNDIWIAATAIQHGIELVTRNREHFARIDGLKITTY